VYAVKITDVPVSSLLGSEAVDVHLLATLKRARSRKPRHTHLRLPRRAKLVYSIGAIFRVGAADIVFFSESPRRRFPTAAIESHLLSLLYSRAEEHKL
jgi:hypothetical protein